MYFQQKNRVTVLWDLLGNGEEKSNEIENPNPFYSKGPARKVTVTLFFWQRTINEFPCINFSKIFQHTEIVLSVMKVMGVDRDDLPSSAGFIMEFRYRNPL